MMTEQQKKRLVGAAAVIVSAVILLPLLLDGSGYRERHLQDRIPPAPEMPALVDIEPSQRALPDTAAPADPAAPAVVKVPSPALRPAIAQSQPSIDATNDTPVLDEQQVPVAWTLQLASFRDEANARSLRKELVEAGYKVYIRHSPGMVRVFVGPDLQRSRLEQLQMRLKRDYSLEGMIVRFTTQ
ncbi:SPOR domain-containing protein [Marinobacterium sediminicola]|uniref:DedD protein n=1 Tax=Marinobacterium sediminicola TaxID=518898 RepID=A0ABY1RVI4_9GAMM|nr:SPOR domain-containing protein [Marinobacterium sediminicola]ULG70636.1 SPOR domain-containing protein [Marinobacterium sediminicola]SMR68796.1 DedD protein [Marinobacterium sediminicola]